MQASPFCKVVREVLCELELPFVQQTVSRGSPRRQELLDQEGHFQVGCAAVVFVSDCQLRGVQQLHT